MEAAVVAAVLAVAVVGWMVLFCGRGDIWRRTWAVAATLIACSVGGLALVGELEAAFGPTGPGEVAAGAGVGVAWLVATHVGHAALCRLLPALVEQVDDLYQLGEDDPPRRVIGPILAMAAAEELVFRGVVQSQWGIVAAVVAYAAVQVVERNGALVLAAFLGGVVWGGLYWWTSSLVAAFVAHALWTASLTLLWPLRACADREVPGPVRPRGREARA